MAKTPEPPRRATKSGVATLCDVLRAAAPRPTDSASTADKIRYAARFANQMAVCIANGLRDRFEGILPDEAGGGVESPAQSVRGPKKLDVNFSTTQIGLGFGISLKSVHFREKAKRGYIHNLKRNDEELRNEASGYHQRQPFAVMIAVVFLPADAYDDASDRHSSSFGAWVKYLRPLSGRRDPGDDIARFEKVFVGTYDSPGTTMEFFDVENAPPRTGRPKAVLTYLEFLDQVEKSYLQRNAAEFHWVDSQDTDEDDPERSS